MGDFKSFRQESKKNWGTEDEKLSQEEIKIGCLLRIADACDVMAKNYRVMEIDRDLYKRWYEQKKEELDSASRHSRALRGVITKLKKKIQCQEQN